MHFYRPLSTNRNLHLQWKKHPTKLKMVLFHDSTIEKPIYSSFSSVIYVVQGAVGKTSQWGLMSQSQ